jgi:polygalacturonase
MMKTYFTLFFILILSQSITYAQYNITKFGAIGDAKTLNTQAIQQAIDKCTAQGGGVVKVPKGVFLTGTIVLKTGVKLEITEGGILLGSSKREDYQKNDWYALILAKGQKTFQLQAKALLMGKEKI